MIALDLSFPLARAISQTTERMKTERKGKNRGIISEQRKSPVVGYEPENWVWRRTGCDGLEGELGLLREFVEWFGGEALGRWSAKNWAGGRRRKVIAGVQGIAGGEGLARVKVMGSSSESERRWRVRRKPLDCNEDGLLWCWRIRKFCRGSGDNGEWPGSMEK